ncbi:hypothetical protein [Actinomadura litoris]|uniref:Uncharacterized protein n=1 Tax=Actinomadura litoris TaxID=2678616 RepID=A0A7K1LAL4_9ACTN|nr:hypothetical protein [Actinomadura litoris]MUN41454.1 hypothetical protein [Actinomadura litoris]
MQRCTECAVTKPDVRERPDPCEEDVNGREVRRDLCDDCEAAISNEV